MKEARMSILKMVEDGKINADEAVKLLDAIGKTAGTKRSFDSSEVQSNVEEKVKAFAKNLDEMGKELGKKLDEVGKDVEPKLRKVAQTVIDKTTECVDEITKTLKKEECCCEENEECCSDKEECCNEEKEECCGEKKEEGCCNSDNSN